LGKGKFRDGKNIWVKCNPQSSDPAHYQPGAKEIADYYTNDHAGKKTDLHHLNAPPILDAEPFNGQFSGTRVGSSECSPILAAKTTFQRGLN
jgi:hypothetical protein